MTGEPERRPIADAGDVGDVGDDGDGSLERLDVALGRLRRLWDQPDVRNWFSGRIDVGETEASMFRTLRAVRVLGPADASVNGVADVLRIDASTASRFLDRAVAAGLAERLPSPVDRRRSSFVLTDLGRERLSRLRAVRIELLGEITATWDRTDVDTLVELLVRLDDAVSELGAQA